MKKAPKTSKNPKQKAPAVVDTAKLLEFKLEKPKLAVAIFDVVIAGDSLIVDRLHSAPPGYGETDVDRGAVAPAVRPTREEVFERAKYKTLLGTDGFPAGGIQAAIRDAAVETEEVSKAAMNRAVTVLGDILPIEFSECQLREDIGRNSGMTRAPRAVIRPWYHDWKIRFQVQLIMNTINPSQLYSLITLAGQCVGIGNWRPGTRAGGSHGRWAVEHFAVAEKGRRKAVAAE